MPHLFYAWITVLMLAGIHLLAGKGAYLHAAPRSRWLSFCGGVSVAYAMIKLLPELQSHQQVLEEAAGAQLDFLDRHAYVAALAGLAVFYGVERAARQSRRATGTQHGTSPLVFWCSIAAFAVYNALVGYLIMREPLREGIGLIFFALAMAPHFIANDFGLEQHHRHWYTGLGRGILFAAIVAGGAAGMLIKLAEPVVAMLVAFLSGGIILNVMKEELPEERESKFWAFAAGAGAYALLLIAFF